MTNIYNPRLEQMSNIVRTAKSGCEWTQGELDAYNIKIKSVGSTAFFAVPLVEVT